MRFQLKTFLLLYVIRVNFTPELLGVVQGAFSNSAELPLVFDFMIYSKTQQMALVVVHPHTGLAHLLLFCCFFPAQIEFHLKQFLISVDLYPKEKCGLLIWEISHTCHYAIAGENLLQFSHIHIKLSTNSLLASAAVL